MLIRAAAVLPVLVVLAGALFLVLKPDLAHSPPTASSTPTPTSGVVAVVFTPPPAATSTSTAQSVADRLITPPATVALPSSTATSTPTPQAVGSLPLAGRRIGLDPGHGPRGDLGAVLTDPSTGKLILAEAEFNLDVALRCRDILVARGASVMLTRETANTFTAPWPADANGDGIVGASGDDLQERVDILNNFHSEVFMSIHANAGAYNASHQDLQVIYCGTSDCAFPTQSKKLGQLVLDQLVSKLAAAGYTATGAQLETDLDADSSIPPLHDFLLGPVNPPRHVRATAMPGVLAESLYVTSTRQAAELNKSSVRQAIALAYADALQAYLTTSQ